MLRAAATHLQQLPSLRHFVTQGLLPCGGGAGMWHFLARVRMAL